MLLRVLNGEFVKRLTTPAMMILLEMIDPQHFCTGPPLECVTHVGIAMPSIGAKRQQAEALREALLPV